MSNVFSENRIDLVGDEGVVGVLSEEDRDVVVTGVSRIGVDEHVHTVITTFGNGVGLEIIALVKNR